MADQFPEAISHLDKELRRRIAEALKGIIGDHDWVLLTREPGMKSKAWAAWHVLIPAELADEDPDGRWAREQRILQTLGFAQAAIAQTGALQFEAR